MRALLGEWDEISEFVTDVPPDPTGRLIILRVALGARLRELSPLYAAVADHPDGDPMALMSMAAYCLDFSGDSDSASWLMKEGGRQIMGDH